MRERAAPRFTPLPARASGKGSDGEGEGGMDDRRGGTGVAVLHGGLRAPHGPAQATCTTPQCPQTRSPRRGMLCGCSPRPAPPGPATTACANAEGTLRSHAARDAAPPSPLATARTLAIGRHLVEVGAPPPVIIGGARCLFTSNSLRTQPRSALSTEAIRQLRQTIPIEHVLIDKVCSARQLTIRPVYQVCKPV